jgi:DNA-directed RNA polymerase subunit M/transcription elongation factor TFIIS
MDSVENVTLKRLKNAENLERIMLETLSSQSRDLTFVKTLKCGENMERGILNLVVNLCSKYDILPNWYNSEFVHLYEKEMQDLIYDLKNSPVLSTKIADNLVLPHEISFMSNVQRNSEKWQLYMKKRYAREASMFEVDLSQVTDQFVCKVCKQRKCVYVEKQTRSADEPMTVFITCILCGYRWHK